MFSKNHLLIFLCWLISLTSTLGSLFFSEVMEYPPCELCWYQRIAMYPLMFIFLVAAYKKMNDVFYYAFPLILSGWIIALYHNLLHYEIIPESAAPCREDVSCSTVYIELAGFITIPMMSFFAFSLLGILLIYFYKKSAHEK